MKIKVMIMMLFRHPDRQLILEDSLDRAAIEQLVKWGLHKRCGGLSDDYYRTNADIKRNRQNAQSFFLHKASESMKNIDGDIALALDIIISEVKRLYPYVQFTSVAL